MLFFVNQKTAYEVLISDWSSDVCSSDLWVEQPLAKIGVGAESSGRFSPFVLLVMTKSSAVEALEVLIVVAPVALAARAWPAALGGILLAITLVSILAVLLHGRLKAVPEVRLKLATGLALLIIGLLWTIELSLELSCASPTARSDAQYGGALRVRCIFAASVHHARSSAKRGNAFCSDSPGLPIGAACSSSVCEIGPTASVLEITTMPISDNVLFHAMPERTPDNRPAA